MSITSKRISYQRVSSPLWLRKAHPNQHFVTLFLQWILIAPTPPLRKSSAPQSTPPATHASPATPAPASKKKKTLLRPLTFHHGLKCDVVRFHRRRSQLLEDAIHSAFACITVSASLLQSVPYPSSLFLLSSCRRQRRQDASHITKNQRQLHVYWRNDRRRTIPSYIFLVSHLTGPYAELVELVLKDVTSWPYSRTAFSIKQAMTSEYEKRMKYIHVVKIAALRCQLYSRKAGIERRGWWADYVVVVVLFGWTMCFPSLVRHDRSEVLQREDTTLYSLHSRECTVHCIVFIVQSALYTV